MQWLPYVLAQVACWMALCLSLALVSAVLR